jgi:hypothetical protein
MVQRGLEFLSEKETLDVFKEFFKEKYTVEKRKDT